MTSIQLLSIVDSGSALYEFQAHLNYWHTLQQRWFVPESLVFHLYLRMLPSASCFWCLSWLVCLSVIPILMYSFGLLPIPLAYGIISWCPMFGSCRLPTVLTSFEDSGYLYVYVHYTHLWDGTKTKFCNWIRRSSWEYRYSLCV